ncbi:hypothetical protein BG842_24880 [Haladaptatus sp. W1]|nr:hypothetical protein BG842_24880 [Haladaptatus sp. W1]
MEDGPANPGFRRASAREHRRRVMKATSIPLGAFVHRTRPRADCANRSRRSRLVVARVAGSVWFTASASWTRCSVNERAERNGRGLHDASPVLSGGRPTESPDSPGRPPSVADSAAGTVVPSWPN